MHVITLLSVLILPSYIASALRYGDDLLEWVETENLGRWGTGTWSSPQNCPPGSFVNGYGVRTNPEGELTSMSLQCSQPNLTEFLFAPSEVIQLGSPPPPGRTDQGVSYTFTRYAIGFSVQKWTQVDGEKFVGGRVIRIKDQEIESTFPPGSHSFQLMSTLCPDGWGLCGVQGRILRNKGEVILTKLRLRCCYFCIPEETYEVLRDYSNSGSTDYKLHLKKSFGTRFETSRTTGGSRSFNRDDNREQSSGTSSQVNTGTTSTDTFNVGQSSSLNKNSGWDLRFGTTDGRSDSTSQDRGERSATSLGTSVETRKTNTNRDKTDNSLSRTTGSGKTASESSTSGSTSRQCRTESSSQSETDTQGSSFGTHASATIEAKAEVGFSGFGVKASASVGTSATAGVSTNSHQEKSRSRTSGSEDSRCSEGSRSGSRGTEVNIREDQSVSVHWGTEAEQMASLAQTSSHTLDQSRDWRSTKSQVTTGENRVDSGKSGSTTLSEEQNRQRGKTLALEHAIQNSAQNMFMSRSGSSYGINSNWHDVGSSTWHEESEELDEFTCEPMHRCVLSQLVGTCGVLSIRTKSFKKTIEKLEPMTPTATVSSNNSNGAVNDPLDIKRPGEIWIVAKNISFFEPSGEWGVYEKCPPGAVVTGYSFKTKLRFALTGLRLTCTQRLSPRNGRNVDTSILQSSVGSGGYWRNGIGREGNSSFVVGYAFVTALVNGTRWTGGQELIFDDGVMLNVPGWARNSSRHLVKCPRDHAVCGLRTMTDKGGIGVLTNVGLKCCHHCEPEEIFVTRHSIKNSSPSPLTQTLRVVVGTDKSQNDQQREVMSDGSSSDSAGISSTGLQAGFSARFGRSSSTEFDWTRTINTMFNNLNETTISYECEPWHLCTYEQLVGICGSVEVATPYAIKSSIPINNPEEMQEEQNKNWIRLEDHDTPFEVIQNGQLWMYIQLNVFDLAEGSWAGKYLSCLDGSFVTAVRNQQPMEIGLTALSFTCSQQDHTGTYKPTNDYLEVGKPGILNASWVNNTENGEDTAVGSPALGFYYMKYVYEDETSTQSPLTLIYKEDEHDEWDFDWPEGTDSARMVKVTCPHSYKLCGVRARIEDEYTDAITALNLRCCYHCEPIEKWNTLDSLKNFGSTMKTQTLPLVVVGTKQHSITTIRRALDRQHMEQAGMLLDARMTGSLKIMFANRFARGSPSGFDWTSTPRDLWSKERERPSSYTCEPGHLCRYKQLVGECGDFEVATAHFLHESSPVYTGNDLSNTIGGRVDH